MTVLLILGALLLVSLFVTSFIFFRFAFDKKQPFQKKIGESVPLTPQQQNLMLDSISWLQSQEKEEVYSYGRFGEHLVGQLIHNSTNEKFAILVHGYRSSTRNFACLAKHYFDMGFSILLPTQRAHGNSEGRYITFGYEESTDMFFWTRYIQHTFGSDVSIVFHGVSMGAATVAMMNELPLSKSIKGLVVDCGYTSATEIFQYILKKDFHIPNFLAKPVLKTASLISEIFAGFPFDECEPVEAVKKAKVPMLFIHGTEDKFVPCEMGIEMYGACTCDEKGLLLIEGAGHGMSYLTDSKLYEERLDGFLSKVM